jgi:hypothetical protein
MSTLPDQTTPPAAPPAPPAAPPAQPPAAQPPAGQPAQQPPAATPPATSYLLVPAAATAPAPPAHPKPDGVTDDEWSALGDPGKAALVRERTARQAAEQQLRQAQAQPTQPAQPQPQANGGQQPDMATLISNAVAAAIAPITQRDAQREADQTNERIRTAVSTAAQERLHDPTDALANINLTAVTDGNGQADPTKITAALDELVARKPHLGKIVDPRRRIDPTAALGGAPGGGATHPQDERVKATLAQMQAAMGIKPR